MDIFKEIKDIEEIYENLVNSAKDRNLKEIELFRSAQQENFESFVSNKNNIVNNVLGNVAIEVEEKINVFEQDLNKINSLLENH